MKFIIVLVQPITDSCLPYYQLHWKSQNSLGWFGIDATEYIHSKKICIIYKGASGSEIPNWWGYLEKQCTERPDLYKAIFINTLNYIN